MPRGFSQALCSRRLDHCSCTWFYFLSFSSVFSSQFLFMKLCVLYTSPQSDLVDYVPVVSFNMFRYPLYFLKVGS